METQTIDSNLIFDLPVISDPAIRPDGETVAYVRSQTDRQTMEIVSTIEITGFGSGPSRPMTIGPADRSPAWSPDGSSLAFLRSETANGAPTPTQVWLIAADGGEARRISDLPNGVLSMSWAPNGKYLVCTSEVDPDATSDRDVAHQPRVREVRDVYYRADTIGWRGNTRRQLFHIDVVSGQTYRLTRGDYDHANPVISPDSKTIAFVSSDRSATRNRKRRGGELCLISAEGGSITRLVRRMNVERPAWAPDGGTIAFVGSEASEGMQPHPFLHVKDLNGDTHKDRPHRITDDRISPQVGSFLVSDGPPLLWVNRRLVFVADSRATSGIYSVTPSGNKLRAERSRKEAITGFSGTPDGSRFAFLSSSPKRPPEMVTLDRASDRAQRRTHSSDDYIASHPPGKVEHFTVSRGGLDIDCWLLFPHNFNTGNSRKRKTYPLVLEIHGGPNSVFMSGFNPLHHIIAGAGFIVLLVNPRGSSTYGVDFRSRVLEDWGGEDYLDLMAAVDAVSRRPYVDEDRVGIHGYSYGGYMASWIVGQTNRFKGAVVAAPITNLLSMYGTTDIGVTWGEDQWGGRPVRNLDWYADRSPLSYAERVETPVLLLHGESDNRCPIGQSEEYFVALKRQGKLVEFVRFPTCSHMDLNLSVHFLRRGPTELQRQYYDRMTDWLKRWV